ncbi:M24 family metallopeptidase [Lacrimispora sp.]|uniref:M24 family metallopeptidase n=1 Tax=Lacrimispora sp. TaxID=2719234 RepID=UPI0028A20EA8|nr:M24 family metallopeptidase [Lacrimispora sp.]
MQKNDFNEKLTMLRQIIKNHHTEGLLLTKQCNINWLTHARSFVGLATEGACFQILITLEKVILISNTIESERLATEELFQIADDIHWETYVWYGETKKVNSRYIIDTQCETDLYQCRTRLSDTDIRLLRELSIKTARIVEQKCHEMKKGMTEFAIAGEVSKTLWEQGIEPVTLLIACDERIAKYRHPLPTSHVLNNYAMIAVNARKHGLFASVTRFVSIGEPSIDLKKKFHALAAVEFSFIKETKAGNSLGNIIKKAIQTYQDIGFSEQWNFHHQGGITGFMARECKPWITSDELVQNNQAFSWNPSIVGAKIEDTILVNNNKTEILTYTGEFKYVEYNDSGNVIKIPDILIIPH